MIFCKVVDKLFNISLPFKHFNITSGQRNLKNLSVTVCTQLALFDAFIDHFL